MNPAGLRADAAALRWEAAVAESVGLDLIRRAIRMEKEADRLEHAAREAAMAGADLRAAREHLGRRVVERA